uniref:SprT-like domain-containing protein n=2 Tax=Nanobsidianus stetteri TaxID=1294122 RepID=A0A2T9WL66_NANST
MKMTTKIDIENIKSKVIDLTKVDSIKILTKKIRAIAYYDWEKDLIVINEDIFKNVSEDCLTYIIVHEVIHKLTNTKGHGAKFLNKLLSIYSMDEITKYETEIYSAIQKSNLRTKLL